MAARRFLSWARLKCSRVRSITAVPPLTLFFATTLTSQALSLTVSDSGRWTPPNPMSGVAIHMALLPGDGTRFNSEILWWSGLNDDMGPFDGGLWGWRPPGYNSYNCTAYPDTNVLKDIPLQQPAGGVFCGSNSSLADGRLFVAGGTQPGTENGVRHVYIFDPRVATWTQVDSMSEARWYATSTALADSRQLVLSGSKDLRINFFGGLRNGEPVPRDKGLFRYGIGYNGHADDAIYSGSGSEWPSAREGQAAVLNWGIHMFGGRDSSQLFDEYWQLERKQNTFAADYDYVWHNISTQGQRPAARWDHSAVTTPDTLATMIIFGGIKKNTLGQSVVTDDVWRLWNNRTPGHGYEWVQVTIQSSPESPPGPRCGHTAFYHAGSRRMFVFGGRDTPTGAPNDNALWALNFESSFNTATWQKLNAVGPSARYDHAGYYDGAWVHPDNVTHIDSTYAFVFGGQLASGKANDLWDLRIDPDTTWHEVNWLAGTRPSPRSGPTLTTAGNLLYVFGGSATDDTVYAAHVDTIVPGELRTWVEFGRHAPALSGHSAILDGGPWARIPEIYDPAPNANPHWTKLSNAPHLQTWYPQAFVSAADTVFVSGPDELSYKLSLNGQTWTPFPSGSSGFLGGSAVMYRPGKVMKCGSRDVEVGGPTPTVGTTKRVDLTAGTMAQWDASANQMLPRVNHNLVLLPNGKVLVVGGTAVGDGSSPVYKPEIWDPNNSGGIGSWFGRDTLAPQSRVRDYHSVALLLPDARVMSAGGWGDPASNRKVEILCPPYLFNTNGSLAARPGLVEAPRVVRYGAQYSFCRSSSDAISMVSLIRPGAVTHGFDENQRFDSLAFTASSGPPPQLTVTFPATAVEAPPGDYLLFVVSTQGVPSIAKWVRLVSSSDVTAPAAVGDLTRDMVATNAVNLTWTAPGDDGSTGTATRVDLRYSLYPINANNFCQASVPDSLPPPGAGGSAQHYAVTGLAPCKTYYFALKYWDEVNNVSVFGDTAAATTLCGDCCSGEARAHVVGEEETAAGGGRTENPTPTAAIPVSTSGAPASAAKGLVVEATPGPSGLVLKTFAVGSYEGHAIVSDGDVLLQRPDRAGRWADWLGYDLPAGNRFALCVPEKPTRWVFLTPFVVAGVLPAMSGEGAGWRLDSARHSTLGDITAALTLADSLPRLGDGDTLVAHYAAAPDSGALPKGWMLLLARSTAAAPSIRAGRLPGAEGNTLPTAFAMLQSQPNPFAERATIRFALPVASRVKLEVFDLLGRRIRTLADTRYEAGEHEVTWDRRTARGALASPGLYYYRIEAGEFREKRAMVILP